MSESYHQGVYLFSDGFERSTHQEHQYRKRDKLMVQGFDAAPPPLVAIEEEEEFKAVPAYESGGMLSEMFNFPASDLLESQIPTNYRPPRPTNNVEWYGTKHGAVGSLDSFGDSKQHIRYSNNNNGLDDNIAENEISVINANSTSSMQLFLMNPQQRSPSPPPPPPPASNHSLQIFRNSPIQQQQFTWGETAAALDNENKIQGLSLSLSSSLQQFEVAKAAGQLRMGGDGRFYYNQGVNTYPLKSFGDQAFHFQGGGHSHEFHNGFGSLGEVGFLRSSKYVKAAQELLEEFCSVGKGLLKKRKLGRQNPNPNLADVAMSSSDVGCVGVSSSSSRDLPPLSPSERFEHQKRKAKFLSMLDEVDGRYNNYIEQLQMVVNSFDSVLGFGAASPYTALTQKAMSRHFRCLKDAISVQLKLVCELLGDKEGAVKPPGITKGETPRLRFLEQCLRQQRSFNQIGMMEHEAWRPQRGLPERSVNILRAWLFEHFLHPYPSDADKHLLARRTGLSRNQVSNWFINARVRLWKPMVEDMYQQEARAEEETGGAAASTLAKQQTTSAQTPKPTPPSPPPGKRYQMDALDNDPSHNTINKNKRQAFTETQANTTTDAGTSPGIQRFSVTHGVPDDTCRVETDYGNGTHVRASGDVSLTLGLRHAGNFGG